MWNALGHSNFEYVYHFDSVNECEDPIRDRPTSLNKEATKFYKLLRKLEQELYPDCKESSTLKLIVEMLNWKCLYGISAMQSMVCFI